MIYLALLFSLLSQSATATYTPSICQPTMLRAAENHYAAGCIFTAMRLCAERWPIGPNNRYDCYNSNITLCDLEAAAFKKWIEQK
jgi:hypothetical protein